MTRVAYDIINMFESEPKEKIKAFILDKYSKRDDVTPEDIDLCFEDIEALIKDGRLLQRTPLKIRLLISKAPRSA